jgi:hypothetical protein
MECHTTNIFILSPSALNEIMLQILGNQGSCEACGGNKIRVSNPIKMFSIIASNAITSA